MKLRIILLGSLLVLILAAGAGGLYFVLKQGRQSQDLFEKAVAAEKRGETETAVGHLRTLLRSDPDHVHAYPLLLGILLDQRKYDEALTLAEERTKSSEDNRDGWSSMIRIHLLRGDVRAAEKLARSRVDVDPVQLQATLWQIHDSSDLPQKRMMAAAAA